MNPEAVLRTFAELSKRGQAARTDVIGESRLLLLQQYRALGIFHSGGSGPIAALPERMGPGGVTRLGGHTSETELRLLSAASLHKTERLLRVGWVWFSGTIDKDGKATTYCFPALSVPVERRALSGSSLRAIGDIEVTELVESPVDRDHLLGSREFGGGGLFDSISSEDRVYRGVDPRILPRLTKLMEWCTSVARAVGLQVEETFTVDQSSPLYRRSEPGIAMHVGCAMYLDEPPAVGTRRESLLNLASLPNLEQTAFAKIYNPEPVTASPAVPVLGIRALSRRQSQIVSEAGARDVSVLSGAPGTGKTHALTVLALDAVSRGQSVLVAASSAHAVDVLVEHFALTPGPTPVAFGGSRHGTRLARELSELVSNHRGMSTRDNAADRDSELLASAVRMLLLEDEARQLDRDPARRILAAEELERAGDLHDLDDMLDEMDGRLLSGWLARRRHAETVRRRLGDASSARSQLERLRFQADAQRLLATGGLELESLLDEAVRLEPSAAEARGRRVTSAWLDRIGRSEEATLAKIATALGASRGTRATLLSRIGSRQLVSAAPLWVGSIRDVDDVLPAVAGLFDLVILDESSQIDQINAANALVRGRRTVVCGDPEQLGHVSFTSDDAVDAAAKLHGTSGEVLNPQKHSVFDAALSKAPALVLDEHFRSAPHLIEFSARRFYGGQLYTSTRHPMNESADHIDVTVVEGTRNGAKVNAVEVAECLRVADGLIEQGWDSIGFLSPFRAQADALEDAILDKYQLEEIDHHGLRVGTVHGFQGDERRAVIASWAIGGDEGDGPWRFVNQKNLFNVMVTRARERLIVVTSSPTPPGLAGDYVRWSQPLENLVRDVDDPDAWTAQVSRALRDAGLPTRAGYRVGRHAVDLVVGTGAAAIAVDCSPHPDGPEAHLDRALLLRRAGWHTADAFQSRWGDRLGQLAIELGSKYSRATKDSQ